ncbi:protein CcmA, bactofilin family [Andreprevotia lacus DSM 23236]|jgi:cytoskeletal protein CcmA (bactofilin family)|uniref:Protein CcmA, bactofilin family n=1 Tax=Andreprevotia lacus DSM 23236 TaxID=1121001 RepID=A0A1W1XJS0_9NEIS|nr:polymer-forming cytoskeletal protein [Andreprevotia lacus]SMC24047.1 protein CcmA, bactofilin family [Andreprevotia lacus DSM 23236]
MFKNKKGSQKIDSLIGHGSVLSGDMKFAGGLRVDGSVIGNVTSADEKNGTLVVSEKARIEGRVKASHLILNGEIVGPLEVTQYVELQPRARVVGDLTYKVLEMHPGAVIEGRLLPLAGARVVTPEDKPADAKDK